MIFKIKLSVIFHYYSNSISKLFNGKEWKFTDFSFRIQFK
jgi:hypothetical protein